MSDIDKVISNGYCIGKLNSKVCPFLNMIFMICNYS